MRILKSSDMALIEYIRIAGNPVSDPDEGVRLAKEFLDSLSPELAEQLHQIREHLGAEGFRDAIFRAIAEEEHPIIDDEKKKIIDERRERERILREKEKKIREMHGRKDLPIAWPVEEEMIMLKDTSKRPQQISIGDRPRPAVTESPRAREPVRNTDANPRTSPIEVRKQDPNVSKVNPPIDMKDDTETVPLRIRKQREDRDKNWWEEFKEK